MSTPIIGPSDQREWDGAALGRLTDALARLYPEGKEARRIVLEAGLGQQLVQLIDFSGAAGQVWYGILSQARVHADGVERILAKALAEYGDDEGLTQAVEADAAPTREEVLLQPLPGMASVVPPSPLWPWTSEKLTVPR
jgi:hypothetical protein